MLATAQEIYTQILGELSPNERLRLATLILNDLVEQPLSVINQSDTWTEQDQSDLLSFSSQYAVTSLYETENVDDEY
ncbi:MAG: hypothetical protein DCF12_05340 [Snowella sp.]|jgi:hypothetical protein|nr:MAG: hypothetical protein DCF12_05340 [Snowella sp.]